MLVQEPHFAVLQLVAVAMVVHIERGDLEAAAELAQTGEAVRGRRGRLYLDKFLIARAGCGSPRATCGRASVT